MSENSKCFCHLTIGGESYEVKDAKARKQALKYLTVIKNHDITPFRKSIPTDDNLYNPTGKMFDFSINLSKKVKLHAINLTISSIHPGYEEHGDVARAIQATLFINEETTLEKIFSYSGAYCIENVRMTFTETEDKYIVDVKYYCPPNSVTSVIIDNLNFMVSEE